jgi:hypothetical protein
MTQRTWLITGVNSRRHQFPEIVVSGAWKSSQVLSILPPRIRLSTRRGRVARCLRVPAARQPPPRRRFRQGSRRAALRRTTHRIAICVLFQDFVKDEANGAISSGDAHCRAMATAVPGRE